MRFPEPGQGGQHRRWQRVRRDRAETCGSRKITPSNLGDECGASAGFDPGMGVIYDWQVNANTQLADAAGKSFFALHAVNP